MESVYLLPAGTPLWRVRNPEFNTPGHAEAPLLFFVVRDCDVGIIMSFRAENGVGVMYVDRFVTTRDLELVDINNYEALETALGLPQSIRHMPGGVLVGDNMPAAAELACRRAGWRDRAEANGFMTEIMLGRMGLAALEHRESTRIAPPAGGW